MLRSPRRRMVAVLLGALSSLALVAVSSPAYADVGRIAWNGTGPNVNFTQNVWYSTQVNTLISTAGPAPTVLGFNFYDNFMTYNIPSGTGAAGASTSIAGPVTMAGKWFAWQEIATGDFSCSGCAIVISYSRNGL